MSRNLLPSAGNSYFKSERSWPFLLRRQELAECLRFLQDSTSPGPRLLRVEGPSGAGKSFFVKELLAQYATMLTDGASVYVDVPPSDLEAFEIFRRIETLLETPKSADRGSPTFVSKKLSAQWQSKKRSTTGHRAAYLYRVFRDLLVLIPVAGHIAKAVLPAALPQTASSSDPAAAFRLLVDQSKSRPIIIALDNLQFLPESLLEILGNELHGHGEQLRLITIERTIGSRRLNWTPAIQNLVEKRIECGAISVDDLLILIRQVLPDEANPTELAATVHRRCDGNLKAAWYQLKLAAERSTEGFAERHPDSYQDVIQSLRPADQMVLRLIVLLLGGLTLSSILALLKASQFGMRPESATAAIADLTALGLLIINGDRKDRIKVEHEIVSTVVTAMTPEEERLELRAHLVQALSDVLGDPVANGRDDALYDRLLGIVHEQEVRASASLQSHLVDFIYRQHSRERFSYLCGLYRDSVCWNVVDLLPPDCVRILLDSIQKCSLFGFGLVATQRLQQDSRYRKMAALYSSKFLVQLFRYEDAARALAEAEPSKERDAVEFNILINLCDDAKAASVVNRIYRALDRRSQTTEYELVVLRNSGHLFPAATSRKILDAAIRGFGMLGNQFGIATCINNLGIVELSDGDQAAAKRHFEVAHRMLLQLDSREAYQPLVNLSAVAAMDGDYVLAKTLATDARRFAPPSLGMDQVMLDFNDAVLALATGQMQSEAALDVFRHLYQEAAKTRDMRFIQVVAWFAASIESQLSSTRTVEYAKSIIDKVLSRSTAGIEVMISVKLNNVEMKAPLVLSPHWRY